MTVAHHGCHTSGSTNIAPGWPIRQALALSIFLALALGAFLVLRRWTGALDVPLAPLQLVFAATLLLAWALAIRALLPGRMTPWLSAVVLLLFAVACSFPGERSVDWIVWLTVFGAFVASHDALAAPSARLAPAAKRRASTLETERVVQQLVRSRSAAGHDVIHGTLLAEFAPGERTTMLYAAFCPPLERLPLIEVESSVEVKVVQAFHHGAQLEIRLPRRTETPTSATVEFFATDAESD